MKAASVRKLLVAGSLMLTAISAQAGLINGGFENVLVPVPNNSYIITNEVNVVGWHTTSTDHAIEIWDDGFSGLGYPGFPITAYEGQYFAEINATQDAMLFQDSVGIGAGAIVDFHFAHRGRGNSAGDMDTMRLTITDLGLDGLFGTGDDTLLFGQNYTTSNLAWSYYTSAGLAPIVALGNAVRFGYASVEEASNNSSIGNFVDAIDFGVGVIPRPVPEPQTWALLAAGLLAAAAARRRAGGLRAIA